MGSQEILSKHGSTGKIGDTQKFNTSIDENLAENGDSTPILSNVIRLEMSHNSSANIYLRYRVDFTSNAVGTEAQYFIHLGLLTVNASDELRPLGTPAARVRRTMDGSNWYTPGHVFG